LRLIRRRLAAMKLDWSDPQPPPPPRPVWQVFPDLGDGLESLRPRPEIELAVARPVQATSAQMMLWLADLAGDDTVRNFTASRALASAGEPARRFLLRARGSKELQGRIAAVLRRLTNELALRPQFVTLKLTDATAEKAIDALARESRIDLVYRNVARQDPAPLISPDLKSVPFREARERLRRAGRLRWTVVGGSRLLVGPGAPTPAENVYFSGPCHLEITAASKQHTRGFGRFVSRDLLILHLMVNGEPGS